MRIIATGDALFASRNLRGRFDPELVALLDEADAVFTNAEFTTPAHDTPAYPEGYTLGSQPWAIDELKSLGVNLVSGANNHAGDYGHVGVLDTLRAFEDRGLTPAGLGRTLAEARRPVFADVRDARIGLIGTATTAAGDFLASDAAPWGAARPGLNPLRWNVSMELPETQYKQLRTIDEALGTARTHRETDRVEIRENTDPDWFNFGVPNAVKVRKGSQARLVWEANPKDIAENCRAIRDARGTADVVIVSIHAHEGEQDGWYHPQPAPFIVEAAHAFVDAGADLVLCHGPHMLRGIDRYANGVIFYSLGSLVSDFETSTRVPVEMFQKYDLADDSYPSDLHQMRRRDPEGNPQGFYGDVRFDTSCFAAIDVDPDDGVKTVTIVPTRLRMNEDRHALRGIPRKADTEEARAIIDRLNAMSEPYATRLIFDTETGTGTLKL